MLNNFTSNPSKAAFAPLPAGAFCSGAIPVVVVNGPGTIEPVGSPRKVIVPVTVSLLGSVTVGRITVLSLYVIAVTREVPVVEAIADPVLEPVDRGTLAVIVALNNDQADTSAGGRGATSNPFSEQDFFQSMEEGRGSRS
jgi:hypothetical protein